MGTVGDALDSAITESFFATLECELLHRHRFRTQTEARVAVLNYLEGLSNPGGGSALAQLSPANYERSHQARTLQRSSDPSKPGQFQSCCAWMSSRVSRRWTARPRSCP
jgi:hypothetical protein